jgi:hypothetical protein
MQEKGKASHLVAIKAFPRPSDLEMTQICKEAIVMSQIKHDHLVSLVDYYCASN